MYPATFDYHRPASVSEAVRLLQTNPEAKLLAGGHSLLPLMKLRLATPTALIDISRIRELAGMREQDGTIAIGSTTRYVQLMDSPLIQQVVPLVAEAASVVGDLQVRNHGTIGGSVAHADPASDLPAAMLALEAQFKAVGPGGERTISASEFFIDLFTTALQPGEVITEIRVPKPRPGSGMGYAKFPHPASGYPVVSAAAVVVLGSSGTAEVVRVGVSGAGPHPTRAYATEEALTGQPLTDEAIERASQRATHGIDLNGDIFAGPEYRGHLTRVYVERALKRAAERAHV